MQQVAPNACLGARSDASLAGGQLRRDAAEADSFLSGTVSSFGRFRHIDFDLIFIDGNHAYEAARVSWVQAFSWRFGLPSTRTAPRQAVKMDLMLCLQMASEDGTPRMRNCLFLACCMSNEAMRSRIASRHLQETVVLLNHVFTDMLEAWRDSLRRGVI